MYKSIKVYCNVKFEIFNIIEVYVSSHNVTLYIISNFLVLKGTHAPLLLKRQNVGEKIEELIHPRGNIRRRPQNRDAEIKTSWSEARLISIS